MTTYLELGVSEKLGKCLRLQFLHVQDTECLSIWQPLQDRKLIAGEGLGLIRRGQHGVTGAQQDLETKTFLLLSEFFRHCAHLPNAAPKNFLSRDMLDNLTSIASLSPPWIMS